MGVTSGTEIQTSDQKKENNSRLVKTYSRIFYYMFSLAFSSRVLESFIPAWLLDALISYMSREMMQGVIVAVSYIQKFIVKGNDKRCHTVIYH